MIASADTVPLHRVVVYVLDPQKRLLVFTQPGSPSAGMQVPAGGIDPNETVLDAARREVLEETGLVCAPQQVLAQIEQRLPRRGVFMNHFVLACCDTPPQEVWKHIVGGSGTDNGMAFECGFSHLEIATITLGQLQLAGFAALHASLA